MIEQEKTAQKEVAYYTALATAWFDTKLERDKSLLALSAGGIGLLITLLSTIGIHSIESMILYATALLSFICSLAAVLWIFKRNANHLEAIHRGKEDTDAVLELLDNTAIFCFFLGVVLSSIMGVSSAFYSFQKTQEIHMASEDKTSHMANDSFSGIKNMMPSPTDTRSFNNAVSMNPAAPAPTQTQTQEAQPVAATLAGQTAPPGNK